MSVERSEMSRFFARVVALSAVLGVGLMSSMAVATVPDAVSHQGRLTDADGEPETGEVELDFRIYDEVSGGALLWEGSETVDLGDSGFYAVELGDESNPLDASVLGGGSAYLGVSVDGGDELEPRLALNSVPYAQVAAEVPFQVGTSMFDAVDSGGGVLGEASTADDAYQGQAWTITSSNDDADGETAMWAVESGDHGEYLASAHTSVQMRLKVSNNSLPDRIATLGCAATRDGEEEVLDERHIAPDDFSGDDVWRAFMLHCDFGPTDEAQRIAVDAYEPNLTSLSVDYVRAMPLVDLPFILSWMLLEDQVTERELAPDSVDTEHLMSESVTGDELADDSVGPDELDDAIDVYESPEGCDTSGLTLSSSCSTTSCGNNCGLSSNQTCYYDCDGSCPSGFGGNNSPQSCSANFVGHLMGADAGN